MLDEPWQDLGRRRTSGFADPCLGQGPGGLDIAADSLLIGVGTGMVVDAIEDPSRL